MKTLQTLKLWLVPHPDCAAFKKLEWSVGDVPLRDVIMQGVHPWMENKGQYEQCPSLADALLMRVNDSHAKLPALEEFQLCPDIPECRSYYVSYSARTQRILDYVAKHIYFVNQLTFPRLVELARDILRERWDAKTAHALAERAYPGFQELRRFLKSKDKDVKLSGYSDLEDLDLSRILTLDDFAGRDMLLVKEAFPFQNFRRESLVDRITDEHGRLRILSRISNLLATSAPRDASYVHVEWGVEVDGESCRFRPDIGKNLEKREQAKKFAALWRTDKGKLCFTTTLDHVTRMYDEGAVAVSFPRLDYNCVMSYTHGTVQVERVRVDTFTIGETFRSPPTIADLKGVLRAYGVPMTGNRDVLLKKLAKLAAEEYEKARPELDAFFAEHRFVRIASHVKGSAELPLLEDQPELRNLLLGIYAFEHLRGEAILDPGHVNDACFPEQAAHAMLTKKTRFNGTLLRTV